MARPPGAHPIAERCGPPEFGTERSFAQAYTAPARLPLAKGGNNETNHAAHTRHESTFGLLLYAACRAVVAGESPGPMPTAPTLFYACMSAGGRTEYDSAAFAHKNPGPVYKDHYELNVKMMAAFDAYLTQKYGFHGNVNCGRYNTLAEAKQWLQGRESHVQGLGSQFTYTATDWTYDAAPIESAPAAATTTPAATVQASQPAASATGAATAFFVCIAVSQGTGVRERHIRSKKRHCHRS